MKRIGIFGGSFNPVHLGHTALAAYICDKGLVDEVWLMVSPQNPLKQDLTLLDENERLHMARLAVAPYPMLKACDFEFTLPRPSYTYHTLQALRKAYPEHEFSIIIGEDNWNNFHRWYRGEDIARAATIIVYPRDAEGRLQVISAMQGSPLSSGSDAKHSVGFDADAKGASVCDEGNFSSPEECCMQPDRFISSKECCKATYERGLPKLLPYSSTEVRNLITQGEDTSHMLHPEVYQYIKAKQLYKK